MASLTRLAIYGVSTVALAYGVHKTTGLTVDDVAIPAQLKASVVAAKETVEALGGAAGVPVSPAAGKGNDRPAGGRGGPHGGSKGKGHAAKAHATKGGDVHGVARAADVLTMPAPEGAPSFRIPPPPSPPPRKSAATQPRPTRVP